KRVSRDRPSLKRYACTLTTSTRRDRRLSCQPDSASGAARGPDPDSHPQDLLLSFPVRLFSLSLLVNSSSAPAARRCARDSPPALENPCHCHGSFCCPGDEGAARSGKCCPFAQAYPARLRPCPYLRLVLQYA